MITPQNLTEFVALYLGEFHPNESLNIKERVWPSRRIPLNLAKEIFLITANKHTCYIEFPDKIEAPLLEHPVLWDLKAWHYASERKERVRKYYKNLQIERELFDTNTKIIARHVLTLLTAFTQEQAETIAHNILKINNFQALIVFGCSEDKLMTKEDLQQE